MPSRHGQTSRLRKTDVDKDVLSTEVREGPIKSIKKGCPKQFICVKYSNDCKTFHLVNAKALQFNQNI